MNAAQSTALERLKSLGLTWGQAQDLALRFHPTVIEQQINWLPLRADVRDPRAFIIAAIEKSFPAPTMETAAVGRGVDYFKTLSAGYAKADDHRRYFDDASELHTQVVSALEQLADFEQSQHMRIATETALQRWPNLRTNSRSFPIALDRALAERLHIDTRGAQARLIFPPAPFGDVDYRDPNRKIAEPQVLANIVPPKKLAEIIPLTPRLDHASAASAHEGVDSAHNPGPSVHEIDAHVHEPVTDGLDNLPAFEDAEVPT